MNLYPRKCVTCGKKFMGKAQRSFCSQKCSRAALQKCIRSGQQKAKALRQLDDEPDHDGYTFQRDLPA